MKKLLTALFFAVALLAGCNKGNSGLETINMVELYVGNIFSPYYSGLETESENG